MAEYKVIYKAEPKDGLLDWEPGCPVMLTALQISRNTSSAETYLQVKVKNISNETIESIHAGLKLTLPDESVKQIPVEYLDCDINGGTEIALKPRKLEVSDVSSCAISFTLINGESKAWKTSTSPQPVPGKEKLPYLPKRALEQRARAINAQPNEEVLNGAVQDHGDWWVCACGQINVNRKSCCSCNHQKELLLANENEQNLLADADKYDDAIYQGAKRLQKEGTPASLAKAAKAFEGLDSYKDSAEQAKQCKSKLSDLRGARNKRLKKAGFIGVAAVAITAALVTVSTLVVIPNLNYKQALNLAESGQYDEAIRMLEDLNDDEKTSSDINIILKQKALARLADNDLDSACETAEQLQARSENGNMMATEIAGQIADCAYNNQAYETAAKWYLIASDDENFYNSKYQYVISNFNYDNQTTYDYLSTLSRLNYRDSATLYDDLYGWKLNFKTHSGKSLHSISSLKDSSTFANDPTGMTEIHLFAKASNHPLSGVKELTVKCTGFYKDDSWYKSTGFDSYDYKDISLQISKTDDWTKETTICYNTAALKEFHVTVLDSSTKDVLYEKTLSVEG